MSSEGFDQRETLGIDAALNRCRTLVARIEDALKKDTHLRDTVAIAEVHAALNRAAELRAGLKNLHRAISGVSA